MTERGKIGRMLSGMNVLIILGLSHMVVDIEGEEGVGAEEICLQFHPSNANSMLFIVAFSSSSSEEDHILSRT